MDSAVVKYIFTRYEEVGATVLQYSDEEQHLAGLAILSRDGYLFGAKIGRSLSWVDKFLQDISSLEYTYIGSDSFEVISKLVATLQKSDFDSIITEISLLRLELDRCQLHSDSGIKLKRADQSMKAQLYEWRLGSYEEAYGWDVNDPCTKAKAVQDVDKYMGSNQLLVLVDENKLIGCCSILKYGGGYAILENFYIDKKYRRQGYGQFLVIRAALHCKEAGYQYIELTTPLPIPIMMYQKCGFRRIGSYWASRIR